MYVTEIYQMLQAAIRQHHKQFPFPKADFNEASEKIKLVVGEFTKDLNEVLTEKQNEVVNRHNQYIADLNESHQIEVENLRSGRAGAWFVAILSILINIYFIFIA